MTLSKQLYIIISFIFFMIFAGNFIISVNNFKDYLVTESTTKSQDTATSLGMILKPMINNTKDPEITSTIRAVANRGFYKEIRLEDIAFNFTKEDLFKNLTNLDSQEYQVKDITIDPNDGEIVDSSSEDEFASELSELEGNDDEIFDNDIIYSFIPSKAFPANKKLNINFIIYNNTTQIQSNTSINISKIVTQVTREEKFEDIPQWFIDLLPMKMAEKKSEISNGWKIKATIYVSANAGDAYAQLYEQAKGAIYYAIVSFIISFILLIIFLRFILQPLKDIETLAKNISKGRFETIKKLPWTLELKNVSISMNDMSSKIKDIINKLNNNLENITEQLSKDALTGLEQESTFNTDMKQMFIKKEDGYIFSVKIDSFGEFAKNNPHGIVDEFLKKFAIILNTTDEKTIAYRFFGSTFTMISKLTEQTEIEKLCKDLQVEFEQLAKEYNLLSVAHIGATPFNNISTTEDILKLANEAYEMAKQISANAFYVRDKNDLARDMLEWKDLIFDIIDNKKFGLEYINQAQSNDKKKILLEEAFTFAIDKQQKIIPIGTFISIAEQYNKAIDFDKAVISKVIDYIKTDNINYEILINLSFNSLLDDNFKFWITNTLLENKDIASQLVFSITAYGCVRDIESFKSFITLVHNNKAKVILKRFETKFVPLDTLKDFNLDYIRLARDYTNNINSDQSKKSFVESICDLSKLLNIKVFAEDVIDNEAFELLSKLGIYGASK